MKKLIKICAIVLGVIAVLVISGSVYFNATYPKVVPAPDVKGNILQTMLCCVWIATQQEISQNTPAQLNRAPKEWVVRLPEKNLEYPAKFR